MEKRHNTQYVSGLKGLACLGVMIGHYVGLVKYIDTPDVQMTISRVLAFKPLALLCNEYLWLYLFFLASGFLLSMGRVESIPALIKKTIKRFLRLGLPVLFACIGIYVLWITVGMHNMETGTLFVNGWFQNDYGETASLAGALLSPFRVLLLGKEEFNAPYWVLRDMFIASILIYVCMYIQSKLRPGSWPARGVAYAGVLLSLLFSRVVVGCMIGFVLGQHRDHAKRFMQRAKWAGILVILLSIVYSVFHHRAAAAILCFGSILLFAPSLPRLERVLSGSILMKTANISFGIYSFHWPVICSIGACILLKSWSLGSSWAFLICWSVCTLISLLLSWLYHITAERLTGAAIKRIL